MKKLIAVTLTLSALISTQAAQSGPLPEGLSSADFYASGRPPAAQVTLGQQLFFDKALSGRNDVSCGTCHSPLTGTSDGLSLGLGVGAKGLANYRTSLGFDRAADAAPNRIVRNSKDLFNIGWNGMQFLLIDGDFAVDPTQPSGFATPLGDDFPLGLNNLVAAQNMFPSAQPREQAGIIEDNPITIAARAQDMPLYWDLMAEKIASIPGYFEQFEAVYDDVNAPEDVTFVHIANALAAFQISAYTLFDNDFNRYLRGDTSRLSRSEVRGMNLFYGEAGCDTCHSGPLLTDQQFWAISIPQIGPGRQTGVDGRDWGRMRITRDFNDKYKYLTPSLLNVALTGPWGHSGAYNSLEAVVRHHLDPIASLEAYDTDEAVLPDRDRWADVDFQEHNNLENRAEMISRNQLAPVQLNNRQISDLVAFLHALTDPRAKDLRHTIPMSVPSGLPVWD